jgi:hypothetical protein
VVVWELRLWKGVRVTRVWCSLGLGVKTGVIKPGLSPTFGIWYWVLNGELVNFEICIYLKLFFIFLDDFDILILKISFKK